MVILNINDPMNNLHNQDVSRIWSTVSKSVTKRIRVFKNE